MDCWLRKTLLVLLIVFRVSFRCNLSTSLPAELVSVCQERKLFDEKFIRLDTRRLCELTSAADALDMKPLVDLTSRALARMIEGKSAEEIRWDNCHVNQHAFHTRQFLLK